MKNVKEVIIGKDEYKVAIGGSNKVAIQSMTNTETSDVNATVDQILSLEKAGCDIARMAVLDEKCAKAIYEIKEKTNIPLVADIHFDYKLAILAMECGIDKIRLNPGNIGSEDKVKQVVKMAKGKNIPIRIGVNSGSVQKEILAKYGAPTKEALVESAFYHINLLNKFDYDNCVVSIKSSNVKTMIESYELFRSKSDIPLHLGVTEAGTYKMGIIKSSIGIGSLLAHGIGETIRVSLTADPCLEVYAAKDILKALGLRDGVEIISCPTCGRTKIDLIKYANEVENALENCEKNIKVAVMGCAVNGPGEAREADIGFAGGDKEVLIFKKGEILKKVPEEIAVKTLLEEIEKI